MNLESQICSLELAKKLRKLGVKQQSLFWHVLNYKGQHIIHKDQLKDELCEYGGSKCCSAFTVAELGEFLPAYANINGDDFTLKLSKYFRPGNGLMTYSAEYWVLTNQTHYLLGKGCYHENEANCRAEMLIYLVENNIIATKIAINAKENTNGVQDP